jgi:hypothetical protein
MSLVVMTLPDEPAELPAWLERQLTGLDLARLIAELTAVHGPGAAGPALEEVLGPHLPAVMSRGLSALPQPLLRTLLTRPALLYPLQELVLAEGGPYWDALLQDNDQLGEMAERGRRSLMAMPPAGAGAVVPSTDKPPRARPTWYARPWVVSLATAALVLLAVGAWRWWQGPQQPAVAQGWGWDRPGALPQDVTAEAYLNALARSAEEWFNKRPETAPELARRILELRQGCSNLLLAEHSPLKEADRRWLRERCRKWAAKFDAALVRLEEGKDVLAVRQEVDETVERLARALREHARQVARASPPRELTKRATGPPSQARAG